MNLKLSAGKFSLSEIKAGKVNENMISGFETKVIKFINYYTKNTTINQRTSGSTGHPKDIRITREQLIYSSEVTMRRIEQACTIRTALLALDPQFIGGKMVIVRALNENLNLHLTEPDQLIDFLSSCDPIDLVSLVPLQIQKVLLHNKALLSKFSVVLIGGAPLHPDLKEQLLNISKVRFYRTYGMSETASHIALNEVGKDDELFKTLGDIVLEVDRRGCLKVKGTVTESKWIQTNDLVEIVDAKSFKWLGRYDFVINSGGIKIFPERLENLISKQINLPFFVAGLPDDRLGSKVVLILEDISDQPVNLDFDGFHKYEKPKQVIKLRKFAYTASGKINRYLTLKRIPS